MVYSVGKYIEQIGGCSSCPLYVAVKCRMFVWVADADGKICSSTALKLHPCADSGTITTL